MMSHMSQGKRTALPEGILTGQNNSLLPTTIMLEAPLFLRLPGRGLPCPRRSCVCAPCTRPTSGTCAAASRAAFAASSPTACRGLSEADPGTPVPPLACPHLAGSWSPGAFPSRRLRSSSLGSGGHSRWQGRRRSSGRAPPAPAAARCGRSPAHSSHTALAAAGPGCAAAAPGTARPAPAAGTAVGTGVSAPPRAAGSWRRRRGRKACTRAPPAPGRTAGNGKPGPPLQRSAPKRSP